MEMVVEFLVQGIVVLLLERMDCMLDVQIVRGLGDLIMGEV
jgi:hypothetical protein